MRKAMEATARSGMYRILADAFVYPAKAVVDALRSGECQRELVSFVAALPETGSEDPEATARCVEALAELAKRADDWTFDRIEEEYAATFGHVLSRNCPPYETEYAGTHIFMQTAELADIGAFYKAFGLEMGKGSHERLDHVSAELQFMSVLCEREAHALTHDLAEPFEACRSAQSRFFEEHIGRWGRFFAELVEQRGASTVYAPFSVVLQWFLTVEAAWLDVDPEQVTSARADDPEIVIEEGPNAEWTGDWKR